MKETIRFPIFVVVLIFIMAVQKFQGAQAAKDHHYSLVRANNHRKEHKVQEPKPMIITGLGVNILCQSVSFINRLFNLNLLRDLCKSVIPNETTTDSPFITTQPTTIQPLSQHIISFSAENSVLYLTCHHVPGTIKLIEATFGFVNSSCPSINVTSKLRHETDDKTSVMLPIFYFMAYCESPDKCANLFNCTGTPFFNGTYTCSPNNIPGSTMVTEAFEWSIFTITCPAGTIAIDSAVYGSIDEVSCPPTSVMGYPVFQGATSSLSSFSFVVLTLYNFNNLCSDNSTNKLSVSYTCQTPAPSTLTSLARPNSVLQLVCPHGEINVTSVILRATQNSSCSSDATDVVRSLVPSNTTEAYFKNWNTLFSCNYSDSTMIASYTCVNTVSQFTSVAQGYTHIVLKCPYGQKIQLVNSKYYCATNSSETVFQNPAGVVRKCDGKESICYFFVTMWTVLEIPSNSSSRPIQYSVFNNCYSNASGDYPRMGASMLSITYTCAA